MKRKLWAIPFIIIFLTVIFWFTNQFVYPLIPSKIGNQIIIAAGILVAVVSFLSNIATILDYIEKITSEHPLSAEKIRVEKQQPLLGDSEQRKRNKLRKRLAYYIVNEILRIYRLEQDWPDDRFVDVAIRVEKDDRWETKGLITKFKKTQWEFNSLRDFLRTLYRKELRLVLLEGAPGSGKSVSLRHLALSLATEALKNKNPNTVLPIYVNLKYLPKESLNDVDIKLQILEFIKLSFERNLDDDDLKVFFRNEFDLGLSEKSWVFLLDSFDEIPKVLSATQSSGSAVETYTKAIIEAITDLTISPKNRCAFILASREFKGPKVWPGFKAEIKQLQSSQLDAFGLKMGLTPVENNILVTGMVQTTDGDMLELLKTPISLSLLCEFIKVNNCFPQSSDEIYSTLISKRLEVDKDRLQQKYTMTPADVNEYTEIIAYCLTADENLGLIASIEEISGSVSSHGFKLRHNIIDVLDAIVSLRFAYYGENKYTKNGQRYFSFKPRRLQDYFATQLVVKDSRVVATSELLENARWRETCVVLLRDKNSESIPLLYTEIELALDRFVSLVPNKEPSETLSEVSNKSVVDANYYIDFYDWPPKLFHLLSLLQDGLADKLKNGSEIRTKAGEIIRRIYFSYSWRDKRWILEVMRIAPSKIFNKIIRDATRTMSQSLKEIAYRQAVRNKNLSQGIGRILRKSILNALKSRRRDARLTVLSSINGFSQEKRDKYLAYYKSIESSLLLITVLAWLMLFTLVIGIVAYATTGFLPINSSSSIWLPLFLFLFFSLSPFAAERFDLHLNMMAILAVWLMIAAVVSTHSFILFFIMCAVVWLVCWPSVAIADVMDGNSIPFVKSWKLPPIYFFRLAKETIRKIIGFIKDNILPYIPPLVIWLKKNWLKPTIFLISFFAIRQTYLAFSSSRFAYDLGEYIANIFVAYGIDTFIGALYEKIFLPIFCLAVPVLILIRFVAGIRRGEFQLSHLRNLWSSVKFKSFSAKDLKHRWIDPKQPISADEFLVELLSFSNLDSCLKFFRYVSSSEIKFDESLAGDLSLFAIKLENLILLNILLETEEYIDQYFLDFIKKHENELSKTDSWGDIVNKPKLLDSIYDFLYKLSGKPR